MLVCIDSDIIVYRAACAAQKTYYVVYNDEGDVTSTFPVGMTATEILAVKPELKGHLTAEVEAEPVSHVLRVTRQMIKAIMREVSNQYGGDHLFRLYLTADDHTNFRYDVAKTKPYKGNRSTPKPVHYHSVRTYLREQWKAVMVSGMEADDAIGIDATTAHKALIVTIDKDLDMIPGYHYNFVKKEFYKVSEFDAYKNFYRQMLSGDTIDNIPGLPGLGKVKAEKRLEGAKTREELEALVRAEYKKAGFNENYYNEMRDLLWIRRENVDEFSA